MKLMFEFENPEKNRGAHVYQTDGGEYVVVTYITIERQMTMHNQQLAEDYARDFTFKD